MTENRGIRTVNKKIAQLMGTDPLPEFKEPTTEDRHKMMYGLAQVYANEGFRKYMDYAIQSQMGATLKSENMNQLFYLKGRILTLKELLNKAKTSFEDVNKLNKHEKSNNANG